MIDKTKIKELRAFTGWTQKDLAGKCGVSPRTIENWEQGRTGISGPALVVLKGMIANIERFKQLMEDSDKVVVGKF